MARTWTGSSSFAPKRIRRTSSAIVLLISKSREEGEKVTEVLGWMCRERSQAVCSWKTDLTDQLASPTAPTGPIFPLDLLHRNSERDWALDSHLLGDIFVTATSDEEPARYDGRRVLVALVFGLALVATPNWFYPVGSRALSQLTNSSPGLCPG